MEKQKFESVFDIVAEEAKELIEAGVSLHATYRKLKDKMPIKTSYTGFYYYAKRNLLNIDKINS